MLKIASLVFSHKRYGVDELEEISERLPMNLFSDDHRVKGYVFLKTCNRLEACISSEKPRVVLEEIIDDLNLDKSEIFVGNDALEHLMRVSCGLESMMVGEDQILGQIKDGYQEYKKKGTTDALLDLVFDRVIRTEKRARSETKINEGSVSIGSAAVELAEDILGCLEEKSILVIGAGEMATLVAKSLSEKGLKAIFIANRTYEKAKILAKEVGGRAVRLNEKEKYLSICDVAISTTSAPHLILDYDLMNEVMGNRRNDADLLIVDIANPRDVEEKVGEIEGVKLYNLDNLHKIREENLKNRLSEMDKVERIIEGEMDVFMNILNRQRVDRLISMIYKYGNHVRDEEKKRALRDIEKGRDPKEVLEYFSRVVLSKTLHTPTRILRNYVKTKGKGVDDGGDDSDFIEFLMKEFKKEKEEGDSSEGRKED